MKKTIILTLITLLLSSQNLSAQDLGAASAESLQTGSSNQWKGWVFASTALVSAAIGVVVVSLNPGSTSH
jgi:hypothetical protein